MRVLQPWYLDLFDSLTDPPSNTLTVSQALAEQLTWWSLCSNLLVGRPFGSLQPSIQLTTDVSLTGWGAHVLGLTANGHWSTEETALHINRAPSSLQSSSGIRAPTLGENSAGDIAQHHCGVLPEQAGRYPLAPTHPSHHLDLELVLQLPHLPDCSAHGVC